MTKKEFNQKVLVGKWVRVHFDDVGARDGIVIEKEKDEIKVFEPLEDSCYWMERSRIVAIGPLVTPPKF